MAVQEVEAAIATQVVVEVAMEKRRAKHEATKQAVASAVAVRTEGASARLEPPPVAQSPFVVAVRNIEDKLVGLQGELVALTGKRRKRLLKDFAKMESQAAGLRLASSAAGAG